MNSHSGQLLLPGTAKGAELTHRNLVWNAEQCASWATAVPGAELALAALPYFHAFGLTCCLHLGLLVGATQVIVPDPRDIEGLVQGDRALPPDGVPVRPDAGHRHRRAPRRRAAPAPLPPRLPLRRGAPPASRRSARSSRRPASGSSRATA